EALCAAALSVRRAGSAAASDSRAALALPATEIPRRAEAPLAQSPAVGPAAKTYTHRSIPTAPRPLARPTVATTTRRTAAHLPPPATAPASEGGYRRSAARAVRRPPPAEAAPT